MKYRTIVLIMVQGEPDDVLDPGLDLRVEAEGSIEPMHEKAERQWRKLVLGCASNVCGVAMDKLRKELEK